MGNSANAHGTLTNIIQWLTMYCEIGRLCRAWCVYCEYELSMMSGTQDKPTRLTRVNRLIVCSVLLFSGSFLKEGGWLEISAVRQ
jgi:hypothetical protein